MTALLAGLGALLLGIILIIFWWWEFIDLLMGAVPIILLLGGALAAYLGFEEIKEGDLCYPRLITGAGYHGYPVLV